MATKKLVEVYSIDELGGLTEQVKNLLTDLLAKVDQANIAYRIKKRSDAIALTKKEDQAKNICKIWMSNTKINLLILNAKGDLGEQNKRGKSIYTIDEIDENLIEMIKKKSQNKF